MKDVALNIILEVLTLDYQSKKIRVNIFFQICLITTWGWMGQGCVDLIEVGGVNGYANIS